MKIESAIENDFLKRTFLTSVGTPQIAYWIGLSDQREEGTWEWTDGSLLGNYTNWENNNPNNLNGNQNCAHIVQGTFNMHGFRFNGFDAGWNEFRCDFTLGYICERVSP